MQFSTKEISGFKVHFYDVLDSTNNQAKLLIDAEQNITNEIITTNLQTAGRGRSNREWDSDEGNLFFSIILNLKDKNSYQLYSFISSLALAKTFDSLGLDSKIKWPNDVLINGKKISGILLETHKDHLIIGIGVNILSHPEFIDSIMGLSATDLLDSGVVIDSDSLLEKYIRTFAEYDSEFRKNGFDNFRKEVISKAYNLKQNISVRHADKVITGTFEDIDINGNLILKTDTETIKINAGEVFSL